MDRYRVISCLDLNMYARFARFTEMFARATRSNFARGAALICII